MPQLGLFNHLKLPTSVIRWVALICLFGMGLVSNSVLAAAPKGIYVAYGRALNENILRAPYLAGVLVRVPWKDIEPVEGQYDWSYLHREINLAQRYGKKVALAVISGPSTPDWVYQAGAESYAFTLMNPHSPRGGLNEQIPLPWDPVFLAKWSRTIVALGKEFGQNPAISLVHVTGSSKNGFELQLPDDNPMRTPANSPRPWVARGFDNRKFVRAWTQIIDVFGRSFPNKYLDIEVHPILGESGPASELVAYGFKQYGTRFGAFGAWLSGRNLAWDKDIQVVMKNQCQRSFCNYQLIANGTRQSHRLGEGGLIGTIQSGIAQGSRYFEVWEVDVKNTNYDQALNQIAQTLANN